MCIHITSLTIPDLLVIHSSLSHQLIDIHRTMRSASITTKEHNFLLKDAKELSTLISKVDTLINSRSQVLGE